MGLDAVPCTINFITSEYEMELTYFIAQIC